MILFKKFKINLFQKKKKSMKYSPREID